MGARMDVTWEVLWGWVIHPPLSYGRGLATVVRSLLCGVHEVYNQP